MNRNDPSLPTALLAGFSTLKGNPYLFSDFGYDISWPQKYVKSLGEKGRKIRGCNPVLLGKGMVYLAHREHTATSCSTHTMIRLMRQIAYPRPCFSFCCLVYLGPKPGVFFLFGLIAKV